MVDSCLVAQVKSLSHELDIVTAEKSVFPVQIQFIGTQDVHSMALVCPSRGIFGISVFPFLFLLEKNILILTILL